MTDTHAADRLVVVVASAGGVEALKSLVAGLPEDLPAAVLVALHLTAKAPSLLPEILERRTRLSVVPASDGLVPTAGTVIVGRPDSHLIVEGGHVRLGHGPAENNHRPSHDVTLRSAALSYGPRRGGVRRDAPGRAPVGSRRGPVATHRPPRVAGPPRAPAGHGRTGRARGRTRPRTWPRWPAGSPTRRSCPTTFPRRVSAARTADASSTG